jgi:membrane associated rhomboid family serine protease
MNAPFPNPHMPATRQPIFNLPAVVTGLIALMLAIHAGRVFILSSDADLHVLLDFSFIPIRETNPNTYSDLAAVGDGARIWTFITYAFLHGDWTHVIVNVVWLAAFGSPVARRFGAMRFLGYAALGAIGGAAVHLAIYPNSVAPVVGASAAISALMAGAARFIFQPSGPLWSLGGFDAYRQPAAPLKALIRDRRVVMFLGVWFAVNLIFGLTNGAGLSSGAIAWDAHLGGFAVGLLFFRLFDPVPRLS